MNEYDSTRIANLLLASHDLELTDIAEEADVLLLNTCSIREKAQEKVFSQLGYWRSWKHNNPNLIIGVGGCVASQEGEDVFTRAPFVDLVFGPQTIHRLPQMISDVRKHKANIADTSFPQIEKFDCLPTHKAKGPTAFVSIMEGCSNYCTYCV
ncbi:(dimethylallyl)adenosine tRNA methylthiotransferase, partial [Achromatium sp. WMS1]